ncbi:MAG: PHP domain-containing protein [Pseudomonadota bacterium]
MKRNIHADLHNHTTASDGDFSPETMIIRAKACGIRAVAVTDHDTVSGIPEALDAGIRHGITVIPGVEVSVRFKRPVFTGTLHLLCYFPTRRLNDTVFMKALQDTLGKGRGEPLVMARVAEINRCFGPDSTKPLLARSMTAQDIIGYGTTLSRRHFALALGQKHNVQDQATINAIIGNKSPAYVPSGIDLADVATFIRTYPMVTVLAHPAAGSFTGPGHYREVLPPVETVETFLPELIEAGLDGLEVHYPGHTNEHQEMLLSWAGRHSLIVTGGSDCHDESTRPPGVAGMTRDEFKVFMALLTSR